MAEALVKFFLQRLDSLLLQETLIFSGLEDQILCFKRMLSDIGWSLEDLDLRKEKGDDYVRCWVRELKAIIHDMDDHIEEFIIQMKTQSGSDQTALIASFRSELEKIEARLDKTIKGMPEHDNSMKIDEEKEDETEKFSSVDEGETSHSASFDLNYRNLPYYLRVCLMYCCIFPENYWIRRGRLVQLLLAEGLIQERQGEIMEDIAKENIEKLMNLGMLHGEDDGGTKVKVPNQYREFLLHVMEEDEFIVSCTSPDSHISPTARRVSINFDAKNIPTNLNNFPIRSLFIFGIKSLSESELDCLRPLFCGNKFLRVLDLENVKIKNLPGELEDLIHLRYLGLKNSDIDELPESLSNLWNLQTLDIRWNGKLTGLSNGILNFLNLRHLKMFKNMGVCGMKVPTGIGKLKNLQTLTGIYAGGGIAAELGGLTQLRRLGVMDLAEDHASELFVSIMKMEGLLSLSLESTHSGFEGTLLPLEKFSPPPLLQKLRLEGRIETIPNWFGLMGNVTKLRLGFSHLSENPALVLQHLPNLKHLCLWHAFDLKQIGREFCKAGGFPKLEVLLIASRILEEWTELEEGSLPSLKHLGIHNCLKLRVLPEGLQHLTTLQRLRLFPLLDDHAERLKPDGGEENHKIRHIPLIKFIPTSVVEQLHRSAFGNP